LHLKNLALGAVQATKRRSPAPGWPKTRTKRTLTDMIRHCRVVLMIVCRLVIFWQVVKSIDRQWAHTAERGSTVFAAIKCSSGWIHTTIAAALCIDRGRSRCGTTTVQPVLQCRRLSKNMHIYHFVLGVTWRNQYTARARGIWPLSRRRNRLIHRPGPFSSAMGNRAPGLDLPLVTGRFTAVTGLTGLDRLRYRPVTNR
jgi:hypothetical protein